ncbi:MAG: serine protease, partial [Candidatus Parabeggiatoa sp. nov. 2]
SGRLDGSLPQAQIKAAGYSKPRLGLILAAGYSSPAEVIRYWMSSQSRTYLLDERFSDVGIGYVYKPSSPYRHYWVIIFGGNY